MFGTQKDPSKTEKATPKRVSKQRAEGNVPKSQELGKAVSRLLAYTVCRGYVSRHVGIGVTAWVLRNLVEWKYLMALFRTFERLMGTKDFMRIISSAARANPMTPRLSQARMGS